MLGPETSFTSKIEQPQSENLKLTIELDVANGQAMKETELKEMAMVETTRLQAMSHAAEVDKQRLQQEVQKLQDMLEFLRHTTSKSVDDFLNQLKLDLNPPIGG